MPHGLTNSSSLVSRLMDKIVTKALKNAKPLKTLGKNLLATLRHLPIKDLPYGLSNSPSLVSRLMDNIAPRNLKNTNYLKSLGKNLLET